VRGDLFVRECPITSPPVHIFAGQWSTQWARGNFALKRYVAAHPWVAADFECRAAVRC